MRRAREPVRDDCRHLVLVLDDDELDVASSHGSPAASSRDRSIAVGPPSFWTVRRPLRAAQTVRRPLRAAHVDARATDLVGGNLPVPSLTLPAAMERRVMALPPQAHVSAPLPPGSR